MSEQVSSVRRQLLQARKQVLKELGHLHECMQVEIDLEPDEGDEEIVELDRNAVITAILNRRLQAIDAALHLIDEGRYGVCARCGQPILQERLLAQPDATLCVQCQREIERLERYRRPVRQVEW
ncbi:MAG TPA: TraR/DksA family transcriptional regulator [Caldilineaceae bacterium]|nr:TraR/DksA family transcriptional regulator [Caldilineaceae bacterium]